VSLPRQSIGARIWTVVVIGPPLVIGAVLSVIYDLVEEGPLVLLAPMAAVADRVGRARRAVRALVRRPPADCPAARYDCPWPACGCSGEST
jgi:hypothetical protein